MAARNRAGHRLGVPAPSRERRSHRRLVLIGVSGAAVVATALAVFVVAQTDGPNAVETDVSQGPNADLPVGQQAAATPWPAGEGPGSNSLNVPGPDATVTVGQQADATPWPAGEGPGSNSLNVPEPSSRRMTTPIGLCPTSGTEPR